MARIAWPLLLGALCNTPALAAAGAADGRMVFDTPPLAPDRAVTAIGLRAGVSVGLSVPCHGPAIRLTGRVGVREAIDRVLRQSDCRPVWIDATTVRIERRPAAPPPPKLSPPAAPPRATGVAEVVVTASKRELTAEALPGSVSVATAQALSDVHARDSADLRLLASGVTVTNLGPGRDKVLLRGLSDGAFTGRTQSTVGVYWNGVPTTYNAPDPDLRLVDIGSVEVLRGPQGTLYGAGALGGVVDVLPRPPEFRRWSGSVSTEGSVTAGGGPSGALETVLNVPFGERAAARLVAYGAREGGWIDLPALSVQHANHVQQTGMRAALRLSPAPGWDVTLGNIYQDISSDDTQYTTDTPNGLVRSAQVRQPHDNDFEQAYADVHGHGSWGDLRSLTAVVHHDFSSRYDASSALTDFSSAPGRGAYDDANLIRLTSEELDYRPPPFGRLSVLVGAYGGYGDEHERTSLGPLGAAALYGEARSDLLTDLALFGEASYTPLPRLTVTAGVRLSYAERRTLSRVTETSGQAAFAGDTSTHETSPKLAADYEIARHWHVYALASRGYRIGGFNTAGLIGRTSFTGPGGAEPNRFYAPDELWNTEVGLKLKGWRGRLEGRSALYYDVWRGLQADQFQSSGLPYVANVGTAHISGWEWELAVRPYRGVKLQLGALFTAPDLRKVNPAFPAGRSDFTLPGVARRSLNGEVSYLWRLGGERTLEVGAAAVYVGHSYLFFGPQGSNEMGRYLDGRLQALFSTGRWGVGLTVSNPANNRGDTFAFGNPFYLTTQTQRTPLRPRTVSLRLERAF